MCLPNDLKYTANHEWARPEADGSVSCGITAHGQELLGDMVYVGAPEIGRQVADGEACGVVESVKTASDLHAPLAGEVVAVNDELADVPEKINQDPYGAWVFRIRPHNPANIGQLLDAVAYLKLVDGE
jgi:glycine cleavage system H protein